MVNSDQSLISSSWLEWFVRPLQHFMFSGRLEWRPTSLSASMGHFVVSWEEKVRRGYFIGR